MSRPTTTTTSATWKRRSTTIPAVLAATVIGVAALPLLVPLAIVVDVARLRFRLPTLRLYLFALQYLLNDTAEIVLAPFLWLLAGAGTRLDSEASIARHERLQWWSAALLQRRAEQLLGMRMELDDASETALTPGPVIVLARHVSLFDATLPGLLYIRRGFVVRAVVMQELLSDPGFDLIYGRTGSAFIPRGGGAAALDAAKRMTDGLGDNGVAVIFPEGRLFRPDVASRQRQALAEQDPQRADRLSDLQNVLAPRPGGVLALLEAMPDADVVVVDHRGLDQVASLSQLAKRVPLRDPVRVTARRFDRRSIPTTPADRIDWLDSVWLDLDTNLNG